MIKMNCVQDTSEVPRCRRRGSLKVAPIMEKFEGNRMISYVDVIRKE
jgi:hypothetical protein